MKSTKNLFKNKCREFFIEGIIFLISLIIYLIGASHSLVLGDTGEFLSSAAVHGVPHDPGFPLYSLITSITFSLPFAHNAWIINAISSLFASLALVFTFKITKKLTNNIASALFSILCLGTYEFFWFYAEVAQIHMLQVLILSSFFYFLILYINTKKIKFLYACGFIFGLGTTNNQTIIFVVPSLLLILLYLRRELTFKKITKLILFSILGLTPYIYTFWSASINPPINWGRIHDFSSFIYVFFRGDYGTFYLNPPEAPKPFFYYSFIYFFTSIFKTSWYILPFSIASIYYLFKKELRYVVLFLTFCLIGPFFYFIMNQPVLSINNQTDVEQYLSYSFFFISIFAGLGLQVFFIKYKIKKELLFSILLLLFFIPTFFLNWQKVRQDNDKLVEVTSKFELSQLPKNSILLVVGDNLYFPALYWQYVENYRRDITIIQWGLLNAPWYQNNLEQMHPELATVLSSNGIDYSKACKILTVKNNFFVYPYFPSINKFFQNDGCKIIPYGTIDKVIPKTAAININSLKTFNDTSWENYFSLLGNLNDYANKTSRTREEIFYTAEQLDNTGIYYQNEGKNDWSFNEYKLAANISSDELDAVVNESALLVQKGQYQEAISLLEQGKSRDFVAPALYKNLGILYYKTNQQAKAYDNFKKYLSFNPTDPDTQVIINLINSYQTLTPNL